MPNVSQPDIKMKIRQLETLFEKAPIGPTFGMKLSYTSDGRATFNLPYNPKIDSPVGIHGGVISTLADMAGWFTAAIHYENWIATIDLHVKYIKYVEKKDILATGNLVSAGKRIAVATMEIRTTEDLLIAIGTGTFSKTSVPFPAL